MALRGPCHFRGPAKVGLECSRGRPTCGSGRSKTFVSSMTREVEHFARKMPVRTSSNRFGNFLQFGC